MLILASASPRRQDLLRRVGVPFNACDPGGDGPRLPGEPADQVLGHALHKACAVAARFPAATILAADTLVAAGGRVLGKPADRKDAQSMLEFLSGREHEVWTATVLLRGSGVWLERAERARLAFAPLPAAAVARYLDGTEWCDKAGAYALQGWAGSYATLLAGDPETVVGLRTATVLQFLAATCELRADP